MDEPAPRRLRRAEAILQRRTNRVVLVIERAWNHDNVQAILRTAEAYGVQHVWCIRHPHERSRATKSVTRGSHQWLTVRFFEETSECVAALQAAGCTIWATDLAPGATPVESAADLRPMPERLALILGREVGGVSQELLAAAQRRLYLPMHGFTESFNISVAAALMLQRLFDANPDLPGDMPEEERTVLRAQWYASLAGHREYKQAEYARWALNPPDPLDDPRPAEEFRKPRITKKIRRQF